MECGGCEHRFKLDEGVLVGNRGKFYPGESRKSGLEGFGRVQNKEAGAPVEFETAAYNQTQSVADFMPISSQQMVATTLGVGVLVLSILLMVLGSQPQGLLLDMPVGKRFVLAVFMVLVGVALVLYGCHHRRRRTHLDVAQTQRRAVPNHHHGLRLFRQLRRGGSGPGEPPR